MIKVKYKSIDSYAVREAIGMLCENTKDIFLKTINFFGGLIMSEMTYEEKLELLLANNFSELSAKRIIGFIADDRTNSDWHVRLECCRQLGFTDAMKSDSVRAIVWEAHRALGYDEADKTSSDTVLRQEALDWFLAQELLAPQ